MMSRQYGTPAEIDPTHITCFFEDRAARAKNMDAAVAMLYQDQNPQLAKDRDTYEKAHLLPLMSPQPTDTALDIGCGIGRWADTFQGKIAAYWGLDPIESLITIAREKYRAWDNFHFYTMAAEKLSDIQKTLAQPPSIILITGVLHYMNDKDCLACFMQIPDVASNQSKIIIRVPIAIEVRLTLQNIWSEELNHHYSAIYRTIDEYETMFSQTLQHAGYHLIDSHPLYPPELNNRVETRQHIFILERSL